MSFIHTITLGEWLALGTALTWSVGVVLFTRLGSSMPSIALNLFKNSVAILLLCLTLALMGGSLGSDRPLEDWLRLMASGVLGIAVADTLFFMSLERCGAGLTAIAGTTYAPLIVILSFLFLGERLSWLTLGGGSMIVFGLILSSGDGWQSGPVKREQWTGIGLTVLSIFFTSTSIVMIKPILQPHDVVWATLLRLLSGTAGLLVLLAFRTDRAALLRTLRPGPSWRLALPAAFVGTYLTMMGWISGFALVKETGRAALLNQVSTVFIFLLGVLFLKEPSTLRRVLGVLLVTPGAILVVLG